MVENNLLSTPKYPQGLGYGDYLRFSHLVQNRFGLHFPEKRRMELEIGVRRAFSSSTCTDLDSYFTLLNDPVNGAPELERLVNALTVGETYFFRDGGQFNALITHVLPEIIERRRATRSLRIWSAGCASGEEPYSIAMLLVDLLPDLDDWSISILGTDINTQNLERARKGVFTEWAFREERARQLRPRFFEQQGSLYVLDPQIRRMVTFGQLNLKEDPYPAYSNNTMLLDLILCRNVTIYFPEAITQMVIENFYNSLNDQGWLVVGHSEHSLNTYQKFVSHTFPDAILYQRCDQQAPLQGGFRQVVNSLPPAPWDEPIPEVSELEPQQELALSIEEISFETPEDYFEPDFVETAEPENELESAIALISFGRTTEARELLLRWIEARPNDPQACSLLAKLYADQGNWREAEHWCQVTLCADKLSLDAYYTLALIYQHQGDPSKAIEMMKKVVYIDRNCILGHYCLADLYHHNGNHTQAVKSLDNARRLLETHSNDDLVPQSDGMTVGRLKQAILQQLSQWTIKPLNGNGASMAGRE